MTSYVPTSYVITSYVIMLYIRHDFICHDIICPDIICHDVIYHDVICHETIWANRVAKKVTTMYEMRSELESGMSIKRRSRDRQIREAGNIIQNVIDNFF